MVELFYAEDDAHIADVVKKYLEHNSSLADARDEESKFTLLMICAKKGYFDIAKLLVEEGADINARSRTGITALMFACAEKQRQNQTQDICSTKEKASRFNAQTYA